jgi:hypothetical protein
MTNRSRATICGFVLLFFFFQGRLSARSPEASPPIYGTAFLRTWVPPEYPKDVLKEGLAGIVTLRLVVDAKGTVACKDPDVRR